MTDNGKPGTPSHAEDLTTGRHPGVHDAMQWLAFSHLPEHLRRFSRPLYNAAQDLLREIPTDSAELTTALNALVTAKDHFMRAGIRSTTGRAGSVPRPQEVVDPPQLAPATTGTPVPRNPDEPYLDYLNRAAGRPVAPYEEGASSKSIHHYDDPEA